MSATENAGHDSGTSIREIIIEELAGYGWADIEYGRVESKPYLRQSYEQWISSLDDKSLLAKYNHMREVFDSM
jgi:hypothetical protein